MFNYFLKTQKKCIYFQIWLNHKTQYTNGTAGKQWLTLYKISTYSRIQYYFIYTLSNIKTSKINMELASTKFFKLDFFSAYNQSCGMKFKFIYLKYFEMLMRCFLAFYFFLFQIFTGSFEESKWRKKRPEILLHNK